MAGISGNGFAVLDDLQAKLRTLPKVTDAATDEVAAALETQLKAQIAAGVSPLNKPWKPTLAGAVPQLGSKATVQALKGQVVYKLTGKSYLHHTGIARGHITRQVIPTGSLHPSTVKLILETLQRAMSEHFR